jgi:aromatic-L-amino-acid decarboxylase
VELGTFFEKLVRSSPLFEVVTPRALGLTVFRLVSAPEAKGLIFDSDKLNELNLELHRRITEGSDALFITRTELDGKVCLRMAIGGERTEKKHVQAAFDTFSLKAKDLLAQQSPVLPKL